MPQSLTTCDAQTSDCVGSSVGGNELFFDAGGGSGGGGRCGGKCSPKQNQRLKNNALSTAKKKVSGSVFESPSHQKNNLKQSCIILVLKLSHARHPMRTDQTKNHTSIGILRPTGTVPTTSPPLPHHFPRTSSASVTEPLAVARLLRFPRSKMPEVLSHVSRMQCPAQADRHKNPDQLTAMP